MARRSGPRWKRRREAIPGSKRANPPKCWQETRRGPRHFTRARGRPETARRDALCLFGSIAREEATEESDVDLFFDRERRRAGYSGTQDRHHDARRSATPPWKADRRFGVARILMARGSLCPRLKDLDEAIARGTGRPDSEAPKPASTARPLNCNHRIFKTISSWPPRLGIALRRPPRSQNVLRSP